MSVKRVNAETVRPRRPAARTAEGRENQLISQAVDLASRQLEDGTASAQVITHFLKLATVERQLELEKTRNENRLLEAKIEGLAQQGRIEELYENAIKVMGEYAGHDVEDVIDDY